MEVTLLKTGTYLFIKLTNLSKDSFLLLTEKTCQLRKLAAICIRKKNF